MERANEIEAKNKQREKLHLKKVTPQKRTWLIKNLNLHKNIYLLILCISAY